MPPIGKKEYMPSQKKLRHAGTEKSKKVRCKCGSKKTVKAGIPRGKQRYKCNSCNKRFVAIKVKIKHKKLKQEILVQLYVEGLGIRSISRILQTNHVTLQHWIKEKARKQYTVIPRYARYIEIDELYFYTGKKKKKRWMWLAVCKDSKRILAYQLGTRGKGTLQKLYAKIKPISCEHYYTDEHVSFKGILPRKKHTASKKHTTTIEGINSSVRHFLARFRRKTKCYTKNESMLCATMDLFIQHYNNSKQAA